MDKIARVRQEIERLKKYAEESKKEWINEGYTQNAFAEDCRITSFNRLLSFLDTLKEEPSKSLEEEINKWLDGPTTDLRTMARHFAEWQKEQMMKDAVEGKIYGYGDGSYELVASWLDLPKGGIYKDGDKVRIVVLKGDEE